MSYYFQCHFWRRCSYQDRTLKLGRQRQSKTLQNLEKARLSEVYLASRLKQYCRIKKPYFESQCVKQVNFQRLGRTILFICPSMWLFFSYYPPGSTGLDVSRAGMFSCKLQTMKYGTQVSFSDGIHLLCGHLLTISQYKCIQLVYVERLLCVQPMLGNPESLQRIQEGGRETAMLETGLISMRHFNTTQALQSIIPYNKRPI